MKNKNVSNQQSAIGNQQLLIKLFVLVFTIHYSLFSIHCFSQVGVGINTLGNPPNSKSLLDIDATGMSPMAGLLVPRMSTVDRNAITAPIPESLLIYNTDTHCFEAYYNGDWVSFGCLGGCQVPASPTAGTNTPSTTQIVWNWSDISSPVSYKWGTTNVYGSATDVGTNTSYTQTGLTCNTSYTVYVWAYNGFCNSSYTILTQSTSSCSCAVACGGSGNITTFAGNGTQGYSGDGSGANCAELNYTSGVAVDGAGNVYIADANNVIRKVNTSGIISTIAGNGTGGYSGDGGAATNAELYSPSGVAIDGTGNIYIADQANYRVRKVNTSGTISTIAGNGTYGYNGDGIAATNAELRYPNVVAVDGSGNVYITDMDNYRVRRVTASTGIITTIAGNGTAGFSGDGGAATAAELNQTVGVALDVSGNVYIGDQLNQRIRKVTVSTGIISTFAGSGPAGFGMGSYSGDEGPATSAALNDPAAVFVDVSGNVYIADAWNQRIREVNTSCIISTIAGNGTEGFSGDGGAATNAEMILPEGVAVDGSGNVYIADEHNYRVREVCH